MAQARYEGFGAFAGLGGFIDIKQDVVPDPNDLALEVLEIQDYLENTALPLFAARRIAMEDMQAHFDSESSPAGDKWADLDPDYLRNKESLGFPSEILQREQDLMHAATSQAAWLITESSLFFDTSAIPYYGPIHQTGSGDEANIGIAAYHRFRVRNEEGYEGSVKENLGIGSGNALPARPFIGLSDPAAAEIYEIFDKWFAEGPGTGMFVHPKTGVAQTRGPGGRFGARI